MNKNLIQIHINDSIANITIDNPPKNELKMSFFEEFAECIAQISENKAIKGVIISGQGRHFSSGADTNELFGLFKNNKTIPDEITKNSSVFEQFRNLQIPTIACITGVCLGSATELALNAHFRFAGTSALIGLPEAEFGVIPGLGGIVNTQKLVGTYKTLELILKADSVSSEEALELGIIDYITNKNELLNQAHLFIKSLPDNYNVIRKKEYLKRINSNTIDNA
ncbi:MAG: enoyl-CoA hydratase/isomerase family protein [Bacteroidales bacterium]|nr:enoyl-CoA hydratase/isomerase family protein [Bacteroidales bacterium]